MSIDAIEARLHHRLPEDYKKLVRSIQEWAEIRHPDPEGGSVWFFWGAERLAQEALVNELGSSPRHAQLRLHAELLRNQQGDAAGAVPLDRLAAGFCVGKGEGKLLYLDLQDGGSVWTYRLSDGEVGKIAADFRQWRKLAIVAETN